MKDGGHAFPCIFQSFQNGQGETAHDYGMSLRDWFAGQALAGPVASRASLYDGQEIARIGGSKWMSGLAYNIADAMLKAREEQP